MKGLISRNTIHSYSMEGMTNDEADIPDLVDTLYSCIVEEMRDEGYIPLLDLSPRIFNDYNGGNFKITVGLFGIYVGKRKSREVEGVSGWKTYQRSSTAGGRSSE